ncbi:MAG TPA: radical SAM protein [Nanoarchaeota archaeon]|nr:radical SAM protein [Nanoarchaeota archaeon]
MEFKDIQCKSCMTKSKLTDYVINPYTGCMHGCKYCYAVFIKRFQDIKAQWGDFVYAKANCSELLRKELEKNKPGHIWMSSVTDCYQPIEGKLLLTRKVLETIAKSPHKNKFTMDILTKSSLVKRDFDLIKELNADLGMSVNTLNGNAARIIEPLASSPLERIKTLKEAKEKGIHVYGFISPVLPGITNLAEIFEALQFCEYVWVELLNTRRACLERLMPVIRKEFPDAVKSFDFVINHPEEYYNGIKKEVEMLGKKYKLRVQEIVRHDKD